MRVLGIRPGPWYSVADVYRGLMKGLRHLGCTTIDFNFDDRLDFYEQCQITRDGELYKALSDKAVINMAAKGIEAACYEVWPDIVVVVSGFFVPHAILELMRHRGHTVVLVHTESPYEDDRQLERAALVDASIINDPTNLEQFQEVCPKSIYLPHAYDPEIHYPRDPDPELASDFCFVGTGYESRVEFLEAVDWVGIHTRLAGNWKQLDEASPLNEFLGDEEGVCIDNTDAVDLYCSTKASVNLYRRESNKPELAAGWAMGPREVELAACGTFYMTEPRGENRYVLPMVPSFDSPADFGEKLRWWLAHDEEREKVAAEARAAVSGRTFDENARALLRLVAEQGEIQMARIHGRKGKLYMGVLNAAALAEPIAFLNKWSISFETDNVEVTSFDDDNKTYLSGLPDASGEYAGFYDNLTAQMYTAATDGAARKFYLYPDRTDNAEYFWGTAIFDIKFEGAVDEAVSISGNWSAATLVSKV